MPQQPQNKFKIAIISCSIFLIGVLIIGILGALGIFAKNPYGNGIKIDNFSQMIKSVPTDTKFAIFTSLYSIVKNNTSEDQEIPTSGALIRDGSLTSEYNPDSNITFNTFMVDIPSLQQSFFGQITWSKDEQADLGGYPILFSCPNKDQLIYPAFKCTNMLGNNPTTELYDKYPIISQLPINISYYGSNYSGYTNYVISYEADDDYKNIKLIITDYTGGNRENALNEIRKRGYNPSDYTIEYKDESADQAPGRVPESDIMTDI